MRPVLFATLALLGLPVTTSAQISYQVLHTFIGAPSDGAHAFAGVVQGADGNLYGTTQRGGAFGAGVVYRLTPAGAVTILHSFTGGADGSLPTATLVQGSDGAFYGTTVGGGNGFGTVFRIHASGGFAVLHRFGGFPTDGANPYAPLIQARDGNFYGVTFGGGAANDGTVYRITPGGAYAMLHAFSGINASPFGPLVEQSDGVFYGTGRFGLIFRITATGTFSVVRQLNQATEGASVNAGLVMGTDGNLYGAAKSGGPHGGGTIFRLTSAGGFTLVHAFTGGDGGDGPEAGLTRGPDGAFYGTTSGVFVYNQRGIAFRVTPSGAFTVLHRFAAQHSVPYAPLALGADGAFYGTTAGVGGGASVVFRLAVPMPVASLPFGALDTPAPGAVVAGEVPVTGWALDDTGVVAVRIYRSPVGAEPTQPNGLVFLGNAAFVPGARPDVANAFPIHPNNAAAGWGYMLLSNVFPGGGNGIFTVHAVAEDTGGATSLLGSRAINAANALNVRPFGTIDTPAQGATVSGVVDNFAWALTPPPAAIPVNGSTITVFIDGIAVGNPTYNLFRPDIAGLFPGYANSNGAVGHFSLDTRTLSNGLHTIAWVVVDDRGNTKAIGSRYFTVRNP